MAPVDVLVEGVSKHYVVPDEGSSRWPFSRTPSRRFTALDAISFSVPRGQALGIIGHNGAGKSTLLKLMSGITAPSTGKIMLNGRLAALLEVGSGFHPELSGRENIFLSGSILGMRHQEIRAKLDDIVAFAEVEKFIDLPVKRYSSGMYVRLGFSIAAHFDASILLLDEVLAVGDASFQAKCIERILSLKRQGKTILFISHDMAAVRKLCDRALVLDRGRIVCDGQPNEAIEYYENKGSIQGQIKIAAHLRQAPIQDLRFFNDRGEATNQFHSGDRLCVRVSFTANRPIAGAQLDLFFTREGQLQTLWSSRYTMPEGTDLPQGPGYIDLETDSLQFSPGLYHLDAVIEEMGASDPVEWLAQCAVVNIMAGKPVQGNFYHPHTSSGFRQQP